jgi:hypothetical protein
MSDGGVSMGDLVQMVEAVRVDNLRLRAELDQLHRQVGAGPVLTARQSEVTHGPATSVASLARPPAAAEEGGAQGGSRVDPPLSRRAALLAVGGVAAGGVGLALGSTVLAASPAAAADNQALLQANANFCDGPTSLTNTSSGSGFLAVGQEGTGILSVGGDLGDLTYGLGGDTGVANGAGVVGAVSGLGAIGVRGVVGSEASPGVAAGVSGEAVADAAIGVFGFSSESDALRGVTGVESSGFGLTAQDNSESGTAAINAVSANGLGAQLSGARAPLQLVPATTAGPPTSGTHARGEVYVDSAGAIFICTSPTIASGSIHFAAVWQRITPAASAYNNRDTNSLGLAGSVNLLTAPIRVFDSRAADPPATPSRPKGPVLANSTTQLQIAGVTVGGLSVPAGAVAVVGNVTAAVPAAMGYLTLYPAGGTAPATSNLNYSAGVNVANYCVVVLNASGQMDIFSQAQTDVIFDVTGFIF